MTPDGRPRGTSLRLATAARLATATIAMLPLAACGGRAPQISTPEAHGPADGGPAVATIPSGGVAGPGSNPRDGAAELEATALDGGSGPRRTGTRP